MMLTLSLMTGMLVTWISLCLLKPVAHHARLLDIPSARKKHTGAVPLIGGIAIFLGIASATLVNYPHDAAITAWLLCSLGIVLLGAADDAEDLSVKLRIVMQTLLVLALCIGTGLSLEHVGDLLGLGEIDLGAVSYPFTVIIVLGIINAFNMIDGIDGLLGSVTLGTLFSLVILFNLPAHETELTICSLFIAALIPYLLNNLSLPPFRQKIFMGDSGSMLIGLSISWLLIEGTQGSATPAFRPVTALWLIALPIMDMVRVILQRLFASRSPFAASRDHLHHLLLHIGLGKKSTLAIMSILAFSLAGVGVLTEKMQLSESMVFYGFLITFLAYLLLLAPVAKAEQGCLRRWLEEQSFTQTARKIFVRSGNN